MRPITGYISALTIVVMSCSFWGCGPCAPTSILGPKDKPDFKASRWVKIETGYWVPREKGPSHLRWHRKLIISKASALAKLEDAFSVSEIRPNNLAANRKFVITMADGLKWEGMCYGSEVRLCKSDDIYYSYCITLSDSSFYHTLKQLCYDNEKESNPSIKVEEITF